jgi:hypothetical protein
MNLDNFKAWLTTTAAKQITNRLVTEHNKTISGFTQSLINIAKHEIGIYVLLNGSIYTETNRSSYNGLRLPEYNTAEILRSLNSPNTIVIEESDCSCGAKFTSMPDYHYDWCDAREYKIHAKTIDEFIIF